MTHRTPLWTASAITLLLAAAAGGAFGEEAKARTEFEVAYEAGAVAASEKKWDVAEKKFDEALKAIGEADHPKKAVAKLLLDKAREQNKQQNATLVADELLKLKQWAEAEAAYRKAAETLGENEAIKKGIAAAQAGLKAEPGGAAPKNPSGVAEGKLKPGEPEKEKDKTALEIPAPEELNRGHWKRGAGSQCYWAGERLFLEEGDEYLDRTLSKDFALSVALEAQMDHRSMIRIELRPVKDSGARAKIIGWGSKDGSPPFLAVDKDVKATGGAQPSRQQLTLSLVRTGSKIEFYCNDKLIGHTWDAKVGQPYILWVCGKAVMNGAKIVER